MSGVPWLPNSRAASPYGPLSEAKTTIVLSSTPRALQRVEYPADVIVALH